jgi:methionyl aminopeptidase
VGLLTRCSGSSTCAATINVNPPKPAAATGLLQGALEGQDEDGDDDDDEEKSGADLKLDGQPSNGECSVYSKMTQH